MILMGILSVLPKSCCFRMMFTLGALLCLQKLGATPTLVEGAVVQEVRWKSGWNLLYLAQEVLWVTCKSSKGNSWHWTCATCGYIMLYWTQCKRLNLQMSNAASQSSNNLDPESTRSSLHPIAWRSSRLTWPFAWSKTGRQVSKGLASNHINQIKYQIQCFKWINNRLAVDLTRILRIHLSTIIKPENCFIF